ncbi:MAG: hypothetical protein IT348_06955 [Candidatus Eisenbacteria bacterium]|nr:hypothetical protein [Candidatus Eisenbacteria bacterium]
MNTLRLSMIRAAMAALVLASLTGCGKSSSGVRPQAQSELPQATAQQIAQQSAALVLNGGMLADTRGLLTSSFGPSTAKGSQAARPAATGHIATDSTSGSYELHVFDLDGHEAAWGTLTNDQIGHVTALWDVYSSSSDDTLSFTIHWTSAYDISGFQTAQSRWVFGGRSTFLMDYDYNWPPDRWIAHYLASHQYNGVAYVKSGTPSYPVAGSVACQWQAAWDYRSGAQHQQGSQDVTCTLTFDGTVLAHLTVGTYHYTLNLETGDLVQVNAQASRVRH